MTLSDAQTVARSVAKTQVAAHTPQPKSARVSGRPACKRLNNHRLRCVVRLAAANSPWRCKATVEVRSLAAGALPKDMWSDSAYYDSQRKLAGWAKEMGCVVSDPAPATASG